MSSTSIQLAVPLDGRVAVPTKQAEAHPTAIYAICTNCHGPAAAGRQSCWSCALLKAQVGTLPEIVPLFLFALGSPVHRALVGYKAGASSKSREARALALADALAAWLDMHLGCLAVDRRGVLVVPVPSSSAGRPSWKGRHPLEAVCTAAAASSPRLSAAAVLHRGPEPPRRLQASRSGFVVEATTSLRARHVLVVDDMFVSGARSLSAAAALSRAGAVVLAVVPLGRLVRPEHNEATAAFWERQRHIPYDPATCPRCTPGCRQGRDRVLARTSTALSASHLVAA